MAVFHWRGTHDCRTDKLTKCQSQNLLNFLHRKYVRKRHFVGLFYKREILVQNVGKR